MNLFTILILWSLYWLAVVGATIYILPPLGIDQFHNWFLTSGYFLFFCYISIVRLGSYFLKSGLQISRKEWIVISLAAGCLLAACLIVQNLFPIGPVVFDRINSSQFYFPNFSIGSIIAKICDVLFQQLNCYLLLRTLRQKGLSQNVTICVFSILFFLLHTPLWLSASEEIRSLVFPSLFAGILFSGLIVKVRNGLAWSFCAHLCFYFLIGLIIRY